MSEIPAPAMSLLGRASSELRELITKVNQAAKDAEGIVMGALDLYREAETRFGEEFPRQKFDDYLQSDARAYYKTSEVAKAYAKLLRDMPKLETIERVWSKSRTQLAETFGADTMLSTKFLQSLAQLARITDFEIAHKHIAKAAKARRSGKLKKQGVGKKYLWSPVDVKVAIVEISNATLQEVEIVWSKTRQELLDFFGARSLGDSIFVKHLYEFAQRIDFDKGYPILLGEMSERAQGLPEGSSAIWTVADIDAGISAIEAAKVAEAEEDDIAGKDAADINNSPEPVISSTSLDSSTTQRPYPTPISSEQPEPELRSEKPPSTSPKRRRDSFDPIDHDQSDDRQDVGDVQLSNETARQDGKERCESYIDSPFGITYRRKSLAKRQRVDHDVKPELGRKALFKAQPEDSVDPLSDFESMESFPSDADSDEGDYSAGIFDDPNIDEAPSFNFILDTILEENEDGEELEIETSPVRLSVMQRPVDSEYPVKPQELPVPSEEEVDVAATYSNKPSSLCIQSGKAVRGTTVINLALASKFSHPQPKKSSHEIGKTVLDAMKSKSSSLQTLSFSETGESSHKACAEFLPCTSKYDATESTSGIIDLSLTRDTDQDAQDAVESTFRGLLCQRHTLSPDEWLSATAIGALFRGLPQQQGYVLDPGYVSFQNGTQVFSQRELDLKNQTKVVVPLHHGSNPHWSVASLDLSTMEIQHADSLNLNDDAIKNTLLHFVRQKIHSTATASQWTYRRLDSAQQRNGSDCGIHTLINGFCQLNGAELLETIDADFWRITFLEFLSEDIVRRAQLEPKIHGTSRDLQQKLHGVFRSDALAKMVAYQHSQASSEINAVNGILEHRTTAVAIEDTVSQILRTKSKCKVMSKNVQLAQQIFENACRALTHTQNQHATAEKEHFMLEMEWQMSKEKVATMPASFQAATLAFLDEERARRRKAFPALKSSNVSEEIIVVCKIAEVLHRHVANLKRLERGIGELEEKARKEVVKWNHGNMIKGQNLLASLSS